MTEKEFNRFHSQIRKAIKDKRDGKITGYHQNKRRAKVTARVCSNIETPWYGREALTPNIGRDL